MNSWRLNPPPWIVVSKLRTLFCEILNLTSEIDPAAAQNQNALAQPVLFRLANNSSGEPDFYEREKGMKILGLIIVLFASFSAQANVCITDFQIESGPASLEFNDTWMDGAQLYDAAYKCQDIKSVSTGLKVASLAVQTTALAAACTGAGLPATAILEGGVIALTFVDMIVSDLDCEDSEQEAKIQKKVDDAVCGAMKAQGIKCQPPLRTVEGPSTNIDI